MLLLIDSRAGYARAIIDGIVRYAEHHAAWEFVLESRPRIHPKVVRAYPHIDGVIADGRNPAIRAALRDRNVPAVLVTGPPLADGLPLVTANNVAVGEQALTYFAERGFTRVGFYGHPDTWHSTVRERAFLEAARRAGIECHTRHTGAGRRTRAVRDRETAALVRWIEGLPKPIALLTPSDALGRVVASACHAARTAVPEEVAILGVDNDEIECMLAVPPLSSMDHGTHRIGYEAAAVLDRWLAGQAPPALPIVVEPLGVVTRQSTDTLAIDNTEVAAAVCYIRDHVANAITVADILSHVAVSRRTLELNFKRILGRTMHQEILRTRIARARQLLIQTDWSMPRISVNCGFNYASRFSTSFRRATGLTPHEYRRRFRVG